MFWTRADGAGKPQPLTQSKNQQSPSSFTPDGARLVFSELDSRGWERNPNRAGGERFRPDAGRRDAVVPQNVGWLRVPGLLSRRLPILRARHMATSQDLFLITPWPPWEVPLLGATLRLDIEAWKSDFPHTNRPRPVNAEENEARLRLLQQFYPRPAHSLQPARSHRNRRRLPKPCGP
jgi:hypothetical protein